MAQVGFYHLTRTGLIDALPKLLGRTLESGQRAVVVAPTASMVEQLNKALWEVADPIWLPHGTAAEGDADLQPVWLATEDTAPNGARYLFVVGGADSARLGDYDRVFDLFDGNDEAAVAAARIRWKAAKDAGHDMTYWQQGPRGWERKA